MRVLPSHALSVLFAFLTIITPAIMYNQLSNAQDELQIRNKLALYAYAVDDKQFDLFDQIFTADTNAIYSDAPADQLKGVEALKAYLSRAVAGQVTQHATSSILVEEVTAATAGGTHPPAPFNGSSHSPQHLVNSTAYFVATFFGQGNLSGDVLAIYGTYYDAWVQEKGGDWRIGARTLRNFGPPVGNAAIFPVAKG